MFKPQLVGRRKKGKLKSIKEGAKKGKHLVGTVRTRKAGRMDKGDNAARMHYKQPENTFRHPFDRTLISRHARESGPSKKETFTEIGFRQGWERGKLLTAPPRKHFPTGKDPKGGAEWKGISVEA